MIKNSLHINDNYNHTKNTDTLAFSDNIQGSNPIYKNIDINHLLELFKKRYTNNLHTVRSKIRLLGGLIKYYKNIYPKFWKEELIDTIASEFPDYADESQYLVMCSNRHNPPAPEKIELCSNDYDEMSDAKGYCLDERQGKKDERPVDCFMFVTQNGEDIFLRG